MDGDARHLPGWTLSANQNFGRLVVFRRYVFSESSKKQAIGIFVFLGAIFTVDCFQSFLGFAISGAAIPAGIPAVDTT